MNNKVQRHSFILRELRKKQEVGYTALSALIGVSEDTIRRDITELVDKGLLTKVKGGASVKTVLPISYQGRERYGTPQKEIVGDKTRTIFRSGMTVVFDGGTTPFMVAASLPHDVRLTVITHSFPVANLFLQAESVKTIFIGGTISTNSQITTGIKVYEEYARLHVDICVLGAHSLHVEDGVSDPIAEEAMVKNMMCQVADKTVVVATSDKLGRRSTHRVCETTEIDTLVTELSTDHPLMQSFVNKGVTVI
ncbi:DeoR/GlpR family DNA-binding transcription regulator [Olivibacter sp. XZL3]|uniref:DeoR/GlpR family DNA-binding transcription regulator n=1 Tax=Olivibacter sp. XZL3 TaxID=1735116 RepID=UPI001065207C|nr:DeoR/GlpR family DNA-binding transcription regulator [Olivibacter sp. XZL3]